MDVKRELIRDHEDHERLLEQLTRKLEARPPLAELRQCWADFEENLFDHLATEERYLFSVAVQAHRLEIQQLRAEHGQIRRAMGAISVSVALDTLSKQEIDDLRALLVAHVAHEERSLHHWLEIDEGIMAQRGVLAICSRRERASARLRAASKVSG
ncbi:MAG TPA: hemerythrin domain-containing protein [Polyangiaceae bacterium]|nr:hemerythrin domain-containing protein [Polyangiaceae bacterium]